MSDLAQGSASNISQNDLRRTFIAMLFALVAATIAQQIAELLSVVSGGWDLASSPTKMLENVLYGNGMLLASFSHAFLALLLVSMSWVMWSKSQAAGHKTEIATVFSKEFVLLLIEVFLVVLYFAITKTMEQNFSEYLKNKSIAAYVGTPSGRPEALQLMWVFCVFFIWDIIVDVLYSPRETPPVNRYQKFIFFAQGLLTYCSISMLCIFASWLVSRVAPSNGTAYEALLSDVALIFLLLFFVIGKQLEFYGAKFFPGEEGRKNTKRSNRPSKKNLLMMFSFVGIYIFSTMVLSWPLISLK
jgi:hypothetical protein